MIYSSSDRDYSKSLETGKHRRSGLEGGDMVELQDNIYCIYTLTLDSEQYTSLFYIASCWDCVNWEVGQINSLGGGRQRGQSGGSGTFQLIIFCASVRQILLSRS